MKKVRKKPAQASFSKAYQKLMKDAAVSPPPLQHQWNAQGDAFVKFSLYEHHQTTASPNSNLN